MLVICPSGGNKYTYFMKLLQRYRIRIKDDLDIIGISLLYSLIFKVIFFYSLVFFALFSFYSYLNTSVLCSFFSFFFCPFFCKFYPFSDILSYPNFRPLLKQNTWWAPWHSHMILNKTLYDLEKEQIYSAWAPKQKCVLVQRKWTL